MRFFILIFIFIFIFIFSLSSQSYLQAGLSTGKILKINPIFPTINQNSYFGEMGYIHQTQGKRKWHSLYGFPEVGVTAQVFRFGNSDVFGSAYALSPHISFALVRRTTWKLQLQLGNSLTYITRPHHRQTNRINNVIGTHVNDGTYWRLEGVFFRQKPWQVLAGAGYYHFSNSNFSVPNLGINIPNLMLGIRYRMGEAPEKGNPKRTKPERQPFKVYPGVRLGYGVTEAKVPGGPRYPVYIASVYANAFVGNKIRLKAGTEWFYNLSSYAYVRNFEPELEDPDWGATAAIAFVGAEFTMRRVALVGHLGPYLKKAFQMDFALYTKMGIQYYLFDQQIRHRQQPFVGVFVHSHSGEADFAEFAVGWVF